MPQVIYFALWRAVNAGLAGIGGFVERVCFNLYTL